jgi:transposase InsO family protein
MPYNTNPKAPEIRGEAVRLLHDGWSTRKVARHLGYAQGTIVKWRQKAGSSFPRVVETRSSRPKRSPKALEEKVVAEIIKARIETKRCAEVVHQTLKQDGRKVSLSSVKRTLDRYGLLKKRSIWKKTRKYAPRPDVHGPGDLVEMDTVHLLDKNGKRTYVYTAIDIYSRFGFAMLSDTANTRATIRFMQKAKRYFDFKIRLIQTDNGPEFGAFFSDAVRRNKIKHRHIHVRSPNENGHLERFNRTIQEEMPRHSLAITLPRDVSTYLKHYNEKRMHMGINFKTPSKMLQVIPRC